MPTTLHENRPSAGIGVVEVQKLVVFAIFNMLARPSAGIGVVQVQKLEVFCNFYHARATLCDDRRGRRAKTRGVLRFLRCSHNPLRGSAWSRCKNSRSAWSRCKNSRFLAISAVLAQPSAGIGVVEVQNSRFLRLLLFELVLGSCLVVRAPARRDRQVRDRRVAGSIPPWSAGGRNLHKATCAEQLAQRKLHSRASCTEQLAQTNLHRPVCAERLA